MSQINLSRETIELVQRALEYYRNSNIEKDISEVDEVIEIFVDLHYIETHPVTYRSA